MAQEVATIVIRCENGQENQSLDLSKCGLRSVPVAIYHLMHSTTVLTCDMSGNQLLKLPAKLANTFHEMTDFNAADNKLSSLPDVFGNLKNLTHLDLSRNNYVRLPEAIYAMTSVTHLNLSNNQIDEVNVEKLTDMKSLQVINLEGNPLNGQSYHQLFHLVGVEVKLNRPQYN